MSLGLEIFLWYLGATVIFLLFLVFWPYVLRGVEREMRYDPVGVMIVYILFLVCAMMFMIVRRSLW